MSAIQGPRGRLAAFLYISILSLSLILILAPAPTAVAAPDQDVPILDYTVDASGRARLRIEASAEHYYILHFREELDAGGDWPVSMALGQAGSMTLGEPLAAYPLAHYRVSQHPLSDPGDIDADGIDDLEEFEALGRLAPFNPAEEIQHRDGAVGIADHEAFQALSYQGREVLIDTHLEDLEFVKFYLLDMDTDQPRVYYMNTETHRSHRSFARAIGIEQGGGGRGRGDGPGTMRGEIVFHPSVVAPNGLPGIYRFEFEPNDDYPFAEVQRAYEIIARSMPFLRNNFAYYPMPNAALPRYEREKDLYDDSRVFVLLEEDIYAEVDYLPLNLAEGYGMLVRREPGERPGSREVVIFEALPNELSRVAGIITTVPQTPLSHVNLRAIQDGVPNAYIADALEDARITDLIGKPVYYRVAARDFQIREATLAEVDAHHAARRPSQPQLPARDLSETEIRDLDEIGFADWERFGVKAANLAALLELDFPEGTVPDGFAIPFHYYDAFMQHNGFYEDVEALLADPDFLADFEIQEEALEDLRDDIEDGQMPEWMMEDLAELQEAFPPGTSIRCRSSTNNEDLPGFSGAGLYDSYTHHEDEGHLSKSIKQVYASLWNFRAFDERHFYRIDQLQTAMGVLVHPNYEDEQANGVGVSGDPIYQTDENYYLNTQVGENLVTNPEALSIPEEILLGKAPGSGFTLVRPSNQVPAGQRIMTDDYLSQMRGLLGTIHEAFAGHYDVQPGQDFAMEIEYKITEQGQLEIKQARPWVFDGAGLPVPSPTPGEPEPSPTPQPSASPEPTRDSGDEHILFLPLLERG